MEFNVTFCMSNARAINGGSYVIGTVLDSLHDPCPEAFAPVYPAMV
jgi:hypothetical protein